MYLDYLLKFIKNSKTKDKKNSPVAYAMKQRYELAGGSSLCINEAIILCLSVNDYKLDVSKLAYDTGHELTLLINHATSVGCKKHDEDFFTLVAPFRPRKVEHKSFKGGKKRK